MLSGEGSASLFKLKVVFFLPSWNVQDKVKSYMNCKKLGEPTPFLNQKSFSTNILRPNELKV